ncbi:MAG: MBOAT family protein [Rhodospirillales bacterium]|nr:MBOAT family protein [Rhodospirillales bacterium]
MLFNSYSFVFVFLPLSLAGFYGFSRFGRSIGAAWLILTSFTFFGIWNPRYIPLLLASIIFNFGIGMRLHANSKRPARQKAWLIFGIITDIAVLIYYKYLASVIGFAVGLGLTSMAVPSIILPLGISFFTFTQIGYLIDVQQGVVQDRSALNYALFVTFFPHLIAGPILHNREIMPQFGEKHTYRFSTENFVVGSVMFTIGLAKKCLFADPIASRVSDGFAASGHLSLPGAWLLMLTYAVQLYFDFSGYTDMAIGIARMFNVKFPVNFNSPYKASSIIDFWQRWHMTLTRFLTLYLFNPLALAAARRRTTRGLGVSRTAQKQPLVFLNMVAIPLLITMGLAGIWHGAGLKFFIFGLLHGVYLTINHIWRNMRPRFNAKPGRLEELGSWLLTMIAVLVALVFFRAPTMAVAWQTFSVMVGAHGWGGHFLAKPSFNLFASLGMIFATHGAAAATAGLKVIEAAMHDVEIVLLWLIVLAMPNTQQIMLRYEPVLGIVKPGRLKSMIWGPSPGWALTVGAVGALAAMAISGTTDFVYFQF